MGSRGYRTDYGHPLASKKAARDHNVESVNDIGLISSPQDVDANENFETRKIHAGREAEIRGKQHETAIANRDLDRMFNEHQERAMGG